MIPGIDDQWYLQITPAAVAAGVVLIHTPYSLRLLPFLNTLKYSPSAMAAA